MNGKTFVDTNVLIYAYDLDAKAKHQMAKNLLQELWSERIGVLSLQVLQEFYVNVTRKIPRPISKESARLVVSNYSVWCIETTPAEISSAFQIEDQSKIGFWDALIVASALKRGATRIFSEDLNAGQMIAGILIENPFATAPWLSGIKPEVQAELERQAAAQGCPLEMYAVSLLEDAAHLQGDPGHKNLREVFESVKGLADDIDFSRNKTDPRPVDLS